MRSLLYTNEFSNDYMRRFINRINEKDNTISIHKDSDVETLTIDFLREMMPFLFKEVGVIKDDNQLYISIDGIEDQSDMLKFIDNAIGDVNDPDNAFFMFDDGIIPLKKELIKLVKKSKKIKKDTTKSLSEDDLYPDASFDMTQAFIHQFWYLSKKQAINTYNSLINDLFKEAGLHPDQFVDLSIKERKNRFINYFSTIINDFMIIIGELDNSRSFANQLPILFKNPKEPDWARAEIPMQLRNFIINQTSPDGNWYLSSSFSQTASGYKFNLDSMDANSESMTKIFLNSFYNITSREKASVGRKYRNSTGSEFRLGSEAYFFEIANITDIMNTVER